MASSPPKDSLAESPVKYEDLARLERQFDQVETEISRISNFQTIHVMLSCLVRHQTKLSSPLYTQRAELVAQIPNFWPLVLEQAPPEIDQYIQPSDSALLLSALTELSVSRFELVDAPDGEPRSFRITMTFADNEHFAATTLEKSFWYRHAPDGWSGLVSEPVRIAWKSKKQDLTGGLLDLACDAYDSEASSVDGQMTKAQRALGKKMEGVGMGGMSFFAWFGFVGRRVSAEASAAAVKDLDAGIVKEKEDKEGDEDTAEDAQSERERAIEALDIFPDGDELGIAIAEDLWPGAIKYFSKSTSSSSSLLLYLTHRTAQAQEQDQELLSDLDFESMDEDGSDDENVPDLVNAGDAVDDEDEESSRPKKKAKKA